MPYYIVDQNWKLTGDIANTPEEAISKWKERGKSAYMYYAENDEEMKEILASKTSAAKLSPIAQNILMED